MSLFLLRVSSFAFTLATHHTSTQYVWNDTIAPQSNYKYIIAHETSSISYLIPLYIHEKYKILRYLFPKNHPYDPSALLIHSNSTDLQHGIPQSLE